MEQRMDFGAMVKARRQEMSLTLKEIENATSIRMNLLQGIEEGDVEKLISPVYAHGFITQYAAYLGLEEEARAFQEAIGPSGTPEPEYSYGIGTLEVRDNPGASVKWVPNFVWLGASVLIVLGAWFLAKYLEVI